MPLTHRLEALGLKCSIKSFYENQTLAEICATVTSGDASVIDSLIQLNNNHEGKPLYLVHPMGGRADCYHELAQSLPLPVYGLQAPFVSNQDFAFDDLKTLATLYADAIQRHQPQGPYRLGGWSIGGSIAHHVAQVLSERKHEIEYFVGLDSFIIPVYEQGVSRLEAIKSVVAFIRRDDTTDEEFLPKDIMQKPHQAQLEILYDVLNFADRNVNKSHTLKALQFGIDFFMAKVAIQKQVITARSRLFVAKISDRIPLLLEGWQKGIDCIEDVHQEVDSEHLYILKGESLRCLIEYLSEDIQRLST